MDFCMRGITFWPPTFDQNGANFWPKVTPTLVKSGSNFCSKVVPTFGQKVVPTFGQKWGRLIAHPPIGRPYFYIIWEHFRGGGSDWPNQKNRNKTKKFWDHISTKNYPFEVGIEEFRISSSSWIDSACSKFSNKSKSKFSGVLRIKASLPGVEGPVTTVKSIWDFFKGRGIFL